MTDKAILRLEGVTKQYPNTAEPAADRISLELQQGDIFSLLGPSGCGKTTLLRLIAGFEHPDAGTIAIAGKQVAGSGVCLPPEHRHLGMVFQEYALFPHLTVAENVAFGLQRRRSKAASTVSLARKNLRWLADSFSSYFAGSKEIRQRVKECLALVELEKLERRYPHELSGGQRQRVALARALAPAPAIVLLDEPLSNLDVQVRLYLREEVRKILKETGTTGIFVTHDQEEALAISDRVAVMRQGRLEQLGTPEDIYIKPTSRFVAGFVTQANFIPARLVGLQWQTEVGSFHVAGGSEPSGNGGETGIITEEGELYVREEDLIIEPHDNAPLVIRDRQFLGREHRYCLITPSGREIHARTPLQPMLTVGTRVQLKVAEEALRVYSQ